MINKKDRINWRKQGVRSKNSGVRIKGAPLAHLFKIAGAKRLPYYSNFQLIAPDSPEEISKSTLYTIITG